MMENDLEKNNDESLGKNNLEFYFLLGEDASVFVEDMEYKLKITLNVLLNIYVNANNKAKIKSFMLKLLGISNINDKDLEKATQTILEYQEFLTIVGIPERDGKSDNNFDLIDNYKIVPIISKICKEFNLSFYEVMNLDMSQFHIFMNHIFISVENETRIYENLYEKKVDKSEESSKIENLFIQRRVKK